jgi:hypothetical protein
LDILSTQKTHIYQSVVPFAFDQNADFILPGAAIHEGQTGILSRRHAVNLPLAVLNRVVVLWLKIISLSDVGYLR